MKSTAESEGADVTDTPSTADVRTEVSAGTTLSVTPSEAVPVADHGTVRMVIGALALYLLAVLVAQVALTLKDRTLPDSVLATGAVALGALGSMLTSVRSVKS